MSVASELGTLNALPDSLFSITCGDEDRARAAARVLRRLPPLAGAPIRMHETPGLSDRHGPVHAGSFLRERRISFNCEEREFARIFTHELFHFVWLRLGNARRWSWEAALVREWNDAAKGELGWSAEWRKEKLNAADRTRRTRRWREYCCESFCDTAAWLYSRTRHEEFTLPLKYRLMRRRWFESLEKSCLSI